MQQRLIKNSMKTIDNKDFPQFGQVFEKIEKVEQL